MINWAELSHGSSCHMGRVVRVELSQGSNCHEGRVSRGSRFSVGRVVTWVEMT